MDHLMVPWWHSLTARALRWKMPRPLTSSSCAEGRSAEGPWRCLRKHMKSTVSRAQICIAHVNANVANARVRVCACPRNPDKRWRCPSASGTIQILVPAVPSGGGCTKPGAAACAQKPSTRGQERPAITQLNVHNKRALKRPKMQQGKTNNSPRAEKTRATVLHPLPHFHHYHFPFLRIARLMRCLRALDTRDCQCPERSTAYCSSVTALAIS